MFCKLRVTHASFYDNFQEITTMSKFIKRNKSYQKTIPLRLPIKSYFNYYKSYKNYAISNSKTKHPLK